MAHKPHKETGIFINEVSSHQRRSHKVLELTHSTTKAAGVMLLGAIVVLVVANTAAHGGFIEFWHTEVSFGFGAEHAEMSLAHIINDVLMAIFFLLVGLEIKYEMTVGELTDVRQAILPVAAHARRHLPVVQRKQPRNGYGLGRAHCNRHCFRAWYFSVVGIARSCRLACVPQYSCGSR